MLGASLPLALLLALLDVSSTVGDAVGDRVAERDDVVQEQLLVRLQDVVRPSTVVVWSLARYDATREEVIADLVRERLVPGVAEVRLGGREVVHPAAGGVMERDEVAVRAPEVLDPQFHLVQSRHLRVAQVVHGPLSLAVSIVLSSHVSVYVPRALTIAPSARAVRPGDARSTVIRAAFVEWSVTDETIHKSTRTRTREAIGAYLHRVAAAFERGDPVPVDDSVTVDPPADSSMEVDVERVGEKLSYELEFAWPESEGGVDTDAAVDDGVFEDDASPDSQATFELYVDKASEWRWRLRHDNGNIIADGGEGYSKKANARNGIESVMLNAAGADVEEQD